MKLAGALASLFLASVASADTVSWDAGYDDASRSLTVVSCSDGANGLMTKYGWQTQGQVSNFPNIGGSVDIAGWNSDQCGTCLKISYNGQSINVLAIDHAGAGANISKQAMDKLTNNQADALGRVEAIITKVGVDQCGLTPSKRAIQFNA